MDALAVSNEDKPGPPPSAPPPARDTAAPWNGALAVSALRYKLAPLLRSQHSSRLTCSRCAPESTLFCCKAMCSKRWTCTGPAHPWQCLFAGQLVQEGQARAARNEVFRRLTILVVHWQTIGVGQGAGVNNGWPRDERAAANAPHSPPAFSRQRAQHSHQQRTWATGLHACRCEQRPLASTHAPCKQQLPTSMHAPCERWPPTCIDNLCLQDGVAPHNALAQLALLRNASDLCCPVAIGCCRGTAG